MNAARGPNRRVQRFIQKGHCAAVPKALPDALGAALGPQSTLNELNQPSYHLPDRKGLMPKTPN